jgi:DNA-binding XRE family transcriptional regulator
MKLPTIRSARALAPFRVEVVWSTGRIDRIDVRAALKAHRSLAPALRKTRFATVQPGQWGHSLSWGGRQGREVEIGADALWRLAREQSGGKRVEFSAWRAAHGLSLAEAARSLGLSRRTIAYYDTGAKPVPRLVALALKGFEA